MGCALGTHAVRLAVKDRATNARMLDILAEIASAGAERALVTAAPARC
jgi:hypothetical protein